MTDPIRDTISKFQLYRHLIVNLAIKDFKVRYKSAVLGFLWMIMMPVLQMIVLSIIFSYYVRITTDVPYPLFLLTGLLPWNFLSLSMSTGTYSFIEQSNLVKKMAFPREIIPFAVVLGHSFNLVASLGLFLPVAMVFLGHVSWHMILLPVWFILLFAFVLFLSAITALINVFFRDMRYITEAFLMIWFYATPIFYPVSAVPEFLRSFFLLNPMVWQIEAFRSILFYGRFPGWTAMAVHAAWCIALGLIYTWLYRNQRSIIADYL